MANIVSFSTQQCGDPTRYSFVVDDTLSAITSGGTYYFEPLSGGSRSGCYNVTSEPGISVLSPTMSLVSGYTDCTECFYDTSLYVLIQSCDPNSLDSFPIPISAFTGTLNDGDVYYMSFTYQNKTSSGCFTIGKYGSNPEVELGIVDTSPIPQTTCESCYADNSFVYVVIDCLDKSARYIQLPNDDYKGHLITYEEIFLGQQFCGVVGFLAEGNTPDITLIADLGEYLDPAQCEECLSQVTSKRIITNCLTGIDSVVWSSTLNGEGDFSNLSTSDGCFEVGPLTESAVTINTFLNFDPQPTCLECIECSGIVYDYSSCTNTGPVSLFTALYTGLSTLTIGYNGPFTGTTNSLRGGGATFTVFVDGAGVYIETYVNGGGYRYDIGDEIVIDGSLFGGITGDDDVTITVTEVSLTGQIYSFQYVENSIGTTLFLPWLDDCIEITNYYTSDSPPSSPIYSFNSFTDCSICTGSTNYVWLATECILGFQAIVTTTSSVGPGDIVRGQYGSSNYDVVCFTLSEPYNPSMGSYPTFNSITTDSYQTCDECNSSIKIGISIAECDGSNQQYVNVSLSDYYTITNNGSYIINLNQYDKCYAVVSTCPLNGDYPEIDIRSFYYNCIECVADNTRQPRNAGVEVNICVELCDQTVVSVTPPHPVWSDGYGTEVTQLGMITLGGPNGLNN